MMTHDDPLSSQISAWKWQASCLIDQQLSLNSPDLHRDEERPVAKVGW